LLSLLKKKLNKLNRAAIAHKYNFDRANNHETINDEQTTEGDSRLKAAGSCVVG